MEIAKEVPNIAAKHEGGDPEEGQCLDHPSNILDYFMPKADVLKNGLMGKFERNYVEKHVSLNKTADALIRAGIDVIVAKNAHYWSMPGNPLRLQDSIGSREGPMVSGLSMKLMKVHQPLWTWLCR